MNKYQELLYKYNSHRQNENYNEPYKLLLQLTYKSMIDKRILIKYW